MTATLTDDDGDTGTVTWEWKAGTAVRLQFRASYTPGADDVRKTLSVKASYTQDGDGVTITKSAGTVREAPSRITPPCISTLPKTMPAVWTKMRVLARLGKAIKATDENRTA